MVVGRFAPSPTGPLHIGSLVAAIGSWLMVKSCVGQWLLRIDDLDGPRCRKEFEADILRTLERFGLFWDGPVSHQSDNREAYAEAFKQLQERGIIYPCGCSRAEIARSASAPHPGEEIPYHGRCRSGLAPGHRPRSWRLNTAGQTVCFEDLCHGTMTTDLEMSGDFVVKRADGFFAYQLAVVVDDHLSGVNQVVRGDDLLDSTPRQVLIHQLLGWSSPQYCHLPLVTGPGGVKLSKRDNAISLADGLSVGKEEELLGWALAFLGFQKLPELVGASCGTQLAWALSVFRQAQIRQMSASAFSAAS